MHISVNVFCKPFSSIAIDFFMLVNQNETHTIETMSESVATLATPVRLQHLRKVAENSNMFLIIGIIIGLIMFFWGGPPYCVDKAQPHCESDKRHAVPRIVVMNPKQIKASAP
jgi:hypothetical protein